MEGAERRVWSWDVAAEPTADTTMRGARWMRGKKKKTGILCVLGKGRGRWGLQME